MKYEGQDVFVTIAPFRIYDSRSDALRSVNGDRKRVQRKSVIGYSGHGPYRKPYVYVPIKKRGKKK